MKAVRFKEQTTTYGRHQPEHFPLPAHKSKDGVATTCWKLGLKERLRVLFTGKVFLSVMTYNKPIQPLKMSTKIQDLLKEKNV